MDVDVNQLKFEIWSPGHPNTAAVRKTFSDRMSRLYLGWDDDFDRQFDAHSYLFVLWDGVGTYHATCRIIFKRLGGAPVLTPCETADGGRFSLPDEDTACEGSMVSMTSTQALRRLMYGVTRWLMENGVTRVYTTYDTNNALIRRFHTRILAMDEIAGATVVYRDFLRKDSLEPACWQMVQVNPVRMGATMLANLLKAGGTICAVPPEAPRLPQAPAVYEYQNAETVARHPRMPMPYRY
ncbi:hypothetical protein FCE95_13840 [Luteimonas gilva]|uniref:Acyl-homoserine-lactone synthase n=1 Tax=Luteimonas gilva TaxID=2572684 RepID=A0A4U5JIA7_9GAMM|nr:hypothetical protein [Luteimonas gilva]TKR29242.1 hypothetical protein FCE95_13840 [Luteimonas gilva]